MNKTYKVIVKGWIKKGDKFLLAQRGSTEAHHSGVWSLPGGNIESDIEDFLIENTLKREIEVKDKMELVYNNSFVKTSDGSPVINLTFLCHWESGIAKPLEDTAEIKWFTLEELINFEKPPDFLEKEIKHLVEHLK
jgi:ADP-ribose pyrophosphatase YjhB (NUDIX family)